jgi:hypothetical protein
MRLPRFRIAWLMGFVALVALNLAMIRALSEIRYLKIISLLELGALPMANVLAVSALVRHRRPGSRPFLVGFELFGMVALVLYVASVSYFPNQVVGTLVAPWATPVKESIGGHRPYVFIPILFTGIVVMLCLPQVTFALIGGLLSRRLQRQSISFSR